MMKKIHLTNLTLVCLGLLLSLTWLGAGSALAQEPEPRPPLPSTNGGNGGDGNGDHTGNGNHDSATLPQTGRVSGFVYSYSDYAYVSGVKVVLDGGGWQAETLTDSRGFYQFSGLGAGRGVVNLQLPPGAYPVVFDWPVQVGNGADLRVDLGYYWQEPSALPVLLSGHVASQVLYLEVKNQTTGKINGGMLEITSPVDQQLSPAVTSSQGEIADYGPYRIRLAVGAMEPAASMTVNVPLEEISSLSVEPDEAKIRVAFSYDQQKTPLLVKIDSTQSTASAAPSQDMATTPPPPSSPPLAEPSAPTPTRPISPLPVTGHTSHSTGLAGLILPVLLLLILGWVGWRTFKLSH